MQDPWPPTEKRIRKLIAGGPSDTVVFFPTVPPSVLFTQRISELAQNKGGFILIGVDPLGDTLGVDTFGLLALPGNAWSESMPGISLDGQFMKLDGKTIAVYRVKPKSATGRRKTTAQTQPPANATEAAKLPTAPQGPPLHLHPSTPDQVNDKAPAQNKTPDIAAIRNLLLDAFTADGLRQFCHDRPHLRPILDQFGSKQGLAGMVEEVITYCEKRPLFDHLLDEVKAYNPTQYDRFAAVLGRASLPSPPPLPPYQGPGLPPKQENSRVALSILSALLSSFLAVILNIIATYYADMPRQIVYLVGVIALLASIAITVALARPSGHSHKRTIALVGVLLFFLVVSPAVVWLFREIDSTINHINGNTPQPPPTQPPAPTSSPVPFWTDVVTRTNSDLQCRGMDTGIGTAELCVINSLILTAGITVTQTRDDNSNYPAASYQAPPRSDMPIPLTSFLPVKVSWNVPRQKISEGGPIGNEMRGPTLYLSVPSDLLITPIANDGSYFYPIVTNTLNLLCAVTVNKGSSGVAKPYSIDASARSIGLGYYKWFGNSSIVFTCGDRTITKTLSSVDEGQTPLYDHPDRLDGVIGITIRE